MKLVKYYSLLLIAKMMLMMIKTFKLSGGTSFIGLFVLKFDKNFIKTSAKFIKNEIISVTGTNGKTTTSGIITHILKENKKTVLSNSKGANMLSGIANAFAVNTNPFKKFDYAVLESDEAYLTKLYDSINSDYLLVTNLFRDQLDRYGELSTTAKKIQSAIDKNPNLKLILNADDPLVVNLKPQNHENIIYYGINKINYAHENTSSNAPAEAVNCPVCGKELEYNEHFYAQQGHYFCSCGYKRPNCKYSADVTVHQGYSVISLNLDGNLHEYTTHLVGLYNVYNVLGAIALCHELGINNIQNALDTYHSEFGRSEIREIYGKKAIIQLIKNPTGASEVLKTVDKNTNVLIAINDNYADGRDVSWLWDSDFEMLRGCTKKIITSGIRAYDMAVRLKYAGIENVKVIPDIDKAIKEVSTDDMTILPTYTALLHINKTKYQ